MISPSGKRHGFWKRRHAVSANCATTLFGKLIAYAAQGAEGGKVLNGGHLIDHICRAEQPGAWFSSVSQSSGYGGHETGIKSLN
jgi:hypothetical protein